MIYNYPFYGLSKRYYRYTPYGGSSSFKNHGANYKQSNCNFVAKNDVTQKSAEKSLPVSSDMPLFEIFGIKLYFDDILLICLIFFLYTEGVQDQYLFIALILLLLS